MRRFVPVFQPPPPPPPSPLPAGCDEASFSVSKGKPFKPNFSPARSSSPLGAARATTVTWAARRVLVISPTVKPAAPAAPAPTRVVAGTPTSPPATAPATYQGLTLFHFSAQLEPCLTQETTLHTLNTPNTSLTRATRPLRATPIPYKALKLS